MVAKDRAFAATPVRPPAPARALVLDSSRLAPVWEELARLGPHRAARAALS